MPATLQTPHAVRPMWAVPFRGGTLQLGQRTLLMGVVNVTPDSFSDGGQHRAPEAAIRHGLDLVAAGADLLDIGGESTRPGAAPVAAEEERGRVEPVIAALTQQTSVPISVDTSKAAVAYAALAAGASLVNDVTALRGDPAMAAVVARAHVPIILMHMHGTPQTMQQDPRYDDVVAEVLTFFQEAIARATDSGIARELVWLDPGIGFGKTLEHNLQLLAHLPTLATLDRPLVVGPSRKSFIGQLLDRPVEQRLWGTAGAVAVAAWHGAAIVRVHDVAAMRDVVRVVEAIAAMQG